MIISRGIIGLRHGDVELVYSLMDFKMHYLRRFASFDKRSCSLPSHPLKRFTDTGVEFHVALWRVVWGRSSNNFISGVFNSLAVISSTKADCPGKVLDWCFFPPCKVDNRSINEENYRICGRIVLCFKPGASNEYLRMPYHWVIDTRRSLAI